MNEILTAAELAERLKVRPTTIREWTRDKLIPAVRITPKVIRYDLDAVIRVLQEQRGAAQ
jgi:excisionase family DNA binding protein